MAENTILEQQGLARYSASVQASVQDDIFESTGTLSFCQEATELEADGELETVDDSQTKYENLFGLSLLGKSLQEEEHLGWLDLDRESDEQELSISLALSES